MPQQAYQFPRWNRKHISLKFLHICNRELLTRSLCLLQNLLDSFDPVDGIPLKANFVGISLRRHAIVGRRHKSFWRIEKVRQLVDRHKTGPLEAPVARHREQACPFPYRRQSNRMLANISLAIRVYDVLRRYLPPPHRRFKLSPIAGPVDSKGA